MRKLQLALAWFATWMAGTAYADEIFLKGGSKLEGKARREGDAIVVQVESGEIRLPATAVERIQESTPPAETAQRRRDALGPNDIAGRLELAKYCREHELRATERALLLEIVDRAPDHAAARRLLGHVKTDHGWVDRSQERQVQRDAEQAARLERMRAQEHEAADARAQRDRAQQAEREAQLAREREREREREEAATARARVAADSAPAYYYGPPTYRERNDRRWQPERRQSWEEQAAPRWPIHWMRDPRDPALWR